MADRLLTVGDDYELPGPTRRAEQRYIDAAALLVLEQTRLALARYPEALMVGPRTLNGSGAVLTSAVVWPDGVSGNYAGTASQAFPGMIDSWTVTYQGTTAITYVQARMVRNDKGFIVSRPQITGRS